MILDIRSNLEQVSQGWRASLDGIEVSNRCFFANDESGIVGLLSWDESGEFYYDPVTKKAAQEFLHGKVVIWRDSVPKKVQHSIDADGNCNLGCC